MKKTIKVLLLAVLVICTICAMTVIASATEDTSSVTVVDSGYVKQYVTYDEANPDSNVKNDGSDNDVMWTLTSDGVLTISSTNSSEMTMYPKADWVNQTTAGYDYKLRIPWYEKYRKSITSVVVEESVTSLNGGGLLSELPEVTSITFKAPSVKVGGGSMIFCNDAKLKNVRFACEDYSAYEGKNVIDLRHFTGSSNQMFENCSKELEVTVLAPYANDIPFNTQCVFHESTKATFVVLKDSKGEKYAKVTYPAATSRIYMPAENLSVEYYADLVITGQESDANGRNYKWTLDVDTGALAIEKHEDPISAWAQIDFQDANWTEFAAIWKNYVKDVTVAKFGKISFGYNGGYECFLSGSTSLETVTFANGQRLQNGLVTYYYGWFKDCTALKSVTFGGTLQDGVVDLSGATVTATQDAEATWLDYMFTNCDDIKQIILPTESAVTNIPASAIAGCTSLTDIFVGANIATIEDGAFAPWINGEEGYANLTVTFTEENSKVGLALKEMAAGKLSVNVTENATSGDVSGDANDENDLKWSFDIATGKLTISGTSTSIVWKDGAKAGWTGTTSDYSMIPWYSEYKTAIKTVEITAPVTSIPQYMFGATPKVTKVILPAECVSLGTCAFVQCADLKTLHTAGKEAPEGVIDCRNFTGNSGNQFFESCFYGEATIWMPVTAGSFNPNKKFGAKDGNAKVHFVVYPGSYSEERVREMISNPGEQVYGEFTYSYYTADEDKDLAAKWQALTTGEQLEAYGLTQWTFNVDTGVITVTATKGTTGSGDVSVTNDAWKSLLSTFKYAIKVINFNSSAKLNAGSTISNMPELTTILFNGNRMQGATKFINNPKLTTFGTNSNYVKGVVNLSTWQDIQNSHNHSALLSGTFEGCTSITKVILPAAGARYAVISLPADVFKGCTALETIVIPEGCALLGTADTCSENNASHVASAPFTGTIDPNAFAGLNAIKLINEAADTTVADAILAILPEGSYIYKAPATGAETLTKGIVFDGWSVRVASYNGLRGVFYYDSEATKDNEANGWTLVEYGALLSTAKNKAVTGAVVYYDEANGVTADSTTRLFPIMRNKGGELVQINKVLTNPDDVKTDNVYFAVSIKNYTKNYRTDIYMAGYEVYTNAADEVVIVYTPYSNEKFVETNIYEVTLDMFKAGRLDPEIDKNEIAWNTLTAAGGIVLSEGTHYTLDDAKINGVPTSMATGEAFTNTFNAWNVPVVKTNVGTTVEFEATGLNYSLLADPDADGKYILVYRGNDTVPGAMPYGGGNKTLPQLHTGWYTSAANATSVSNLMPNPTLTANIWHDSISTVIFANGVAGVNGAALYDCGASTLIYSSTLKNINSTAFQKTNLVTAYLAGSKYVDGVIEISGVANVATSYLFDGCSTVKAVHFPANVKIEAEAFKDSKALERVWIGDNKMPEVGVVDFSNLTGTTTLKKDTFYQTFNIKTLIIPAELTSIDNEAFRNVNTLTIQQPVAIETIQAYVDAMNAAGNTYNYYVPESLAGWSGIIVK